VHREICSVNMLATTITMLTSMNSLTTRIHLYFDEVHIWSQNSPSAIPLTLLWSHLCKQRWLAVSCQYLPLGRVYRHFGPETLWTQGTSAPVPKSVQGMLISNFPKSGYRIWKSSINPDIDFYIGLLVPLVYLLVTAAAFDVWRSSYYDSVVAHYILIGTSL